MKSNNNQQQKSFNSLDKSSNSNEGSCKAASFAQINTNRNEDNSVSHRPSCSSRNKMVAKQEVALEPDVQNENDEDFKYGPGFVSKLRYRYLSLTLRQTSVTKQRPSILELRRSTSLNNLLDDGTDDVEEEEENEDVELHEDVSEKRRISETNGNNNGVVVLHENQKNHTRNGIDKHKPLSEHYSPSIELQQQQQQYHIRSSRSIDKNLSLKRARSVEAILRHDHWERDVVEKDHHNRHNEPIIIKATHEVTIEDKIHNARERPYNVPPKRLTSLIDDDERPPPGICKQTMRIFEASANKRRNPQTRPIAQEIASKMAIFKCQNEKPAITAKKPNIAPRTSSPKPIVNHHHQHPNQVNNNNMNNNEKFAKFTKEKTVLPKLDINIIKNNLETKSNGNSATTWTPAENKDSYRIKLDYSPAHSDSSLSSTPNILSPYRNSLSPQLNENVSPKKTAAIVDPASSPIISSLTSKLNNLHMESTSTPINSNNNNKNINLLKSIDDDSEIFDVKSDKESSDNNKSVIVEEKVLSKGVVNSVETKSDDGSKTVNFSQKVSNNLTKISTPATFEKNVIAGSSEMNNGSEVKLVKENTVIMKPTTKPPPPPIPKSRESDTKSSLITSNDNANDSQPKWSVGKKKSWSSSQTSDEPKNSIVFNFCDRKDVPDYIDNDGLILRRKRELPKVSRKSQ